ncbi:MAG: DEDD exonuclease domain-containing protein [Actinobacteria bacterium]|uniref:DEDD exonuclease domain-containing protein n=1 Tax=Nostocoides veronense TaxID=330836 RepID=A0ABP4XRX8_9MICO|nr:DEDD exonuclease domain-containing protein [Actinomycetota bacterium]
MTITATSARPRAIQGTLDDLGTPLHEVTFVVLDLETTGGSAHADHITEIGAVKVRGGQVLGEFQTLVNPRVPIPAVISMLTGITDSMVALAPRIEAVLPSFLEFIGDAVVVAHNARFDTSFLKAAALATGNRWPEPVVVDTVYLARALVTRDEAPNHKLASLARVFHARTTPDHRALHDAQATVDVLHGLLARVGSLGVTTLEELATYSARVPQATRRKRYLADDLPSAPGVYLFKDGQGRVLYVGTSVDIRTRVRSYFTAAEQRRRMGEMVRIAESVTPVVCATALEAQVRELRLIAEHKPRYNRRSRHPEKAAWVKFTVEPFPRLSIVKEVRGDETTYLGPFSSRAAAEDAVAALHDALPLRRCHERLSPARPTPACALAEMGRCGAPCTGAQSLQEYAEVVARARAALLGDPLHLLSPLEERMQSLAHDERYEDAASLRDRLLTLLRGMTRTQRLAPLASSPEIVAARRSPLGGWELVCVRYGRLAGSSRSPRGADPMPYVDALTQSADVVTPAAGPAPAAYPEETEKILRWLEEPGVRLVSVDGEWTCPVGGAVSAIARFGAAPLRPATAFES